jgi:hypothetical protein
VCASTARKKYGLFPRPSRPFRLSREEIRVERWVGTGFSAYWFITVGEWPSIQPSVSWIAIAIIIAGVLIHLCG